jgi:hypothetical protein
MARWGMPSPLFALKGKKTDPGVTNVRNVGSPHWWRCSMSKTYASSPSPASPRTSCSARPVPKVQDCFRLWEGRPAKWLAQVLGEPVL